MTKAQQLLQRATEIGAVLSVVDHRRQLRVNWGPAHDADLAAEVKARKAELIALLSKDPESANDPVLPHRWYALGDEDWSRADTIARGLMLAGQSENAARWGAWQSLHGRLPVRVTEHTRSTIHAR